MVLNTEWTYLEIIELQNELPSLNHVLVKKVAANQNMVAGGGNVGNGGFGFGITGNKSTGVVVKAITTGGSAEKVTRYFNSNNNKKKKQIFI